MRMRHQNMADRFAAHRIQHRRKMRLVIRPRINDRNALMSHDKSVRPLERERPWIVAGYPSDQRRKRHRRSERRFKIPVEFDAYS